MVIARQIEHQAEKHCGTVGVTQPVKIRNSNHAANQNESHIMTKRLKEIKSNTREGTIADSPSRCEGAHLETSDVS